MEIHKLNKLLEKFILNEMSMYENPRKDFAEFRQYVLDNPKAKKSYFVWNNIRIPSDTILHSSKRHVLSLSQWKEFLENYENIIDQKQTSKRRYGGNSTIYVIQINKNKYYCYILESFESETLPIITTVFEDHINSIRSWLTSQK